MDRARSWPQAIPLNHYQPRDCEGSAPLNRLVVSEFPTVEVAQQFYDSAESHPILKRSCSRPFGSPSPIPLQRPALPKASTASRAPRIPAIALAKTACIAWGVPRRGLREDDTRWRFFSYRRRVMRVAI